VNVKSDTGRTPPSWAAQCGELEIVRALARAGADLNVKDEYGGARLRLALWAGHFAVPEASPSESTCFHLVKASAWCDLALCLRM
jgi:hypothetical protein